MLARARALGVARLDAQRLLEHHLQRPRGWLLAHDDELVDPAVAALAWADVLHRADGAPLAYLVGHREFHGLSVQVTPAVLVPRPETEGLVDWALELLPSAAAWPVVDLGTGSGAVALALKHARPLAGVAATDASDDALAVARANAARLQLEITFLHGDWWRPLTGRRFALVVSNPPYIAAGDAHLAALHTEPRVALTPGPSGLEAIRCIVDGARAHLLPGAWLLLEHGHDQADAVRRLLGAAGLCAATTRADLQGLPRCSGAHAST